MSISLSQKLIIAFLAVALITLVLGGIGIWALTNIDENIQTLANQSLPKNELLGDIKYNISRMKSALRTLLKPDNSMEEIQYQLDVISDARATYNDLIKQYEAYPRTPEEEKLFKDADEALSKGATANNEIVALAQRIIKNPSLQNSLNPQLAYLILEKHRKVVDSVLEKFDKISEYIGSYYGEELGKKAMKTSQTMISVIVVISVISFIVALILGIVISRSISRPIGNISHDLTNSAGNMESASMQISASSEELSSGASELASSIEEMTSSLEELQSIIETNTKNINETKLKVDEANKSAQSGGALMLELEESINDIEANSNQIVRIIKVINDIAFQTNILALNAAVEAARAGDAGRGFAVVAEQVKSLAQKSSDAAKETEELIQKAIESVKIGKDRGIKVKESATLSNNELNKANTLIDEVNRASKEQLKGANQITSAVSQINGVVQQTAASSEETSASGEEMLSQAESLQDVVFQLNSMVFGGKKAEAIKNQVNKDKDKMIKHKDQHHQLGKPAQKPASGLVEKENGKKDEKQKKGEEEIPLEDFQDF